MKAWLIKNRLAVLPMLILYGWLVIQTAWVSDDAYITLRSMENFIHGYGPIFNLGERVQVFTHPLWFLGQSMANGIFNAWAHNPLGDGQSYFLNVFMSITLSILAMAGLIFCVAKTNWGTILASASLILSKAYLDYSTSGLENPLTHLILVAFIWLLLSSDELKPNRILFLAFVASLGALDRLDTVLFYLPALTFLIWRSKHKSYSLLLIGLGFLPIVTWEIFSIFYYGFPFPNTAYAKINTGISALSLISQGFFYFWNSLRLDPITLVMIFGMMIYSWWQKEIALRLLAGGILLYLLYTISIGGDFMTGRYFSAPVLVSAAILVRIDFDAIDIKAISSRIGVPAFHLLLTSLVLVLGILPFFLIPERAASFGIGDEGGHRVYVDAHDISDERRVYAGMNLIRRLRTGPLVSEFAREKWVYDPETPRVVKLVGPLGFRGYILGPNAHVIDMNSLADPLMPRMPLYQINEWRIGHFRHFIPKGYVDSLKSGENNIEDANIALYYDKLSFVVRGELWSWSRLVEIWYLNTGRYNHLLENIVVTP